MKKIVEAYLIGVGIGALMYVLAIWLAKAETQTLSNITSCVLSSGFIGIASLIYENERLSPVLKTVIHFSSVFLIVMGMNFYNHWTSPSHLFIFFLEFLVVYMIIWTFFYGMEKHRIAAINKKIEKH